MPKHNPARPRGRAESPLRRGTYAFTGRDLTVRCLLTLTEEQAAFLRETSVRCRREGGKHLDRTQAVRSLVRALRALQHQVDWAGIRDEDALAERLTAAFRR